jgi:L-lactate dehydrogenase
LASDRIVRGPIQCQAKVAIIGAGHVGATFAYALLLSGMAVDVVLVDKDAARARSEALDLSHALPFRVPARVRAGEVDDAAGSDIVVIAAGPNQRRGETRLDLAGRNAIVVRDVASAIGAASPDAIIVVATNPVDVMARLAQDSSGFAPERVIGSGTILDTARLKHLIGKHFGIDPRSVDAHMIGEHGDSAVPLWSLARVGGVRLEQLAAAAGVPFDGGVRDQLAQHVRGAAYAIIEGKGATYYAIGSGLVRIVEAIIGDQRSLLTVSNPVGPGDYEAGLDDVWLSMPRIIGRAGILLSPTLDLAVEERAALARSGEILRAAWNGIR